jgi:hypothetical protein
MSEVKRGRGRPKKTPLEPTDDRTPEAIAVADALMGTTSVVEDSDTSKISLVRKLFNKLKQA